MFVESSHSPTLKRSQESFRILVCLLFVESLFKDSSGLENYTKYENTKLIQCGN